MMAMLWKGFFIGVLITLLCVWKGFAEESPATPALTTQPSVQRFNLHICRDEKLGIRLLCDPDWELQADPNAILIIISSEPQVTLTIGKSKESVNSLTQLSRPILQEIGQYAASFTTQKVRLDNIDTIKVEGHLKEYPENRIEDYYLIRNSSLYTILFSVDPEDQWQNYESLLKRILSSIEFIPISS